MMETDEIENEENENDIAQLNNHAQSFTIPHQILGIASVVLLSVVYIVLSLNCMLLDGQYFQESCPKMSFYPNASNEQHHGSAASVEASWTLIMSQVFWNTVQVLHLWTLVAVFFTNTFSQHALILTACIVDAIVTVLLMPFSTYAGSPAMHISAAFVFAFEILVLWFQNSLSTVVISSSDIDNWTWGNADLRALPKRISSLEFMGFLCNLLCSIYNMYAEDGFPNWLRGFRKLAHYMGYDSISGSLGVQKLYQLGGIFTSFAMPSFIPSSASPESLTAIIFVLAWQILPFIYTTYFMCLFVLSETPSAQQNPTRGQKCCVLFQKMLCAFAIFHFLILTDFVDYTYGRGFRNGFADWAHWSERWVWRVAVILPIYQNLQSGHWERNRGVKYFMTIVTALFFICQVLLLDIFNFFAFVVKNAPFPIEIDEHTPAYYLLRSVGIRGSNIIFVNYYEVLVIMFVSYAVLTFTPGIPIQTISIKKYDACKSDFRKQQGTEPQSVDNILMELHQLPENEI